MNRAARIAISVIVVGLFLAALTYGWRAYANGRKVQQLQAKAEEIFSQPPQTGNADNRGRFEGFRELREQVESLPESYQQQFRQSMGNMFQRREEKRYDDYFALTKLERQKHLDKEIAQDEQRRKQWEARRKQREVERAQQRSSNGGNAAASNGQRGPGGPPNAGGRPPGGRGWGGSRSMSARLDRTSPEARAKREAYRRDKEQRRRELGYPPNRR